MAPDVYVPSFRYMLRVYRTCVSSGLFVGRSDVQIFALDRPMLLLFDSYWPVVLYTGAG